jgi:hypothetical protein
VEIGYRSGAGYGVGRPGQAVVTGSGPDCGRYMGGSGLRDRLSAPVEGQRVRNCKICVRAC